MSEAQLSFSCVRDWREPQIVGCRGLTALLADAAAAGFKARVVELVKKPFGYRVTFVRMVEAS